VKVVHSSFHRKKRRKRRKKILTISTTPTETIRSTELALKPSYVDTKSYPDWHPATVPFPKGCGPRVYKKYFIEDPPYRLEIPIWGKELNPKGWFFGVNGLWHKSFDAIPFYYGDFDEKIIEAQNPGNKYYLLEVKHRLWTYGDCILTQEELDWFSYEVPMGYSENIDYVLQNLMFKRRNRYLVKVKEEMILAKQRYLPLSECEITLEGYFKNNKQKINRAISQDPTCGFRRRTIAEVNKHAKERGLPAPIFKKGVWVNEPNPIFGKFDVKPDLPVEAPVLSLPTKSKGKGKALNPKLRNESRRLLSSLGIKNLVVTRDILRNLRLLESHLYNIVKLSEDIRYCSGKKRRSLINDLYRCISACPFTEFTKQVRGSMETLPPWARRIVIKNLKF
jgi:hypothetical protein